MKKMLTGLTCGLCFALAAPALAAAKEDMLAKKMDRLERELSSVKNDLHKVQKKEAVADELSQDYGQTVGTSPYFGLRTAFDASDLVVKLSTMNEDLHILQERKKLHEMLGQKHLSENRARVQLSGALEGNVATGRTFKSDTWGSSVNIEKAEIDALVDVSPWVSAFFSLYYDNKKLPNTVSGDSLIGSGQRFGNSKIFLRRGFITVGNLSESPVYGSIGQMFVPFIRNGSALVSDPVTQRLGRTNTRAIVLGYSDSGFYGQAYGFSAEAAKLGNQGEINSWGLNAGYKFSEGEWKGEFGAGYLSNLANAEGFQGTGNPVSGFAGFGISSATEVLSKTVDALNVHGMIRYGQFKLLAEYVGVLAGFDGNDLSFNQAGAAPRGLHVEGGYDFEIMDKQASVAAGYGRTWQSLPLNLPEQSYFGVFNISMFKNTVQTLEFRYDKNYAQADSFGGISAGENSFVSTSNAGTKSDAYSVLLQFGVYF